MMISPFYNFLEILFAFVISQVLNRGIEEYYLILLHINFRMQMVNE